MPVATVAAGPPLRTSCSAIELDAPRGVRLEREGERDDVGDHHADRRGQVRTTDLRGDLKDAKGWPRAVGIERGDALGSWLLQ